MTDRELVPVFPMRPLGAEELESCQSQVGVGVAEMTTSLASTGDLVSLCVAMARLVARVGRRFGAVGLLASGSFEVVAREGAARDPRVDETARRGAALRGPGGGALGRDIAVRRVAAAFVAGTAGLGGVVVSALDGLVAELGDGRELVVGIFGAFVLCALEARVDPELVCALLSGDGWR